MLRDISDGFKLSADTQLGPQEPNFAATKLVAVLIFGIFCPLGSAEVENGAGISQNDRLDALLGAVFKRSNDLGYSYE